MARAHACQRRHGIDSERLVQLRQHLVLHPGDCGFQRRDGSGHRAELSLAALAFHHHQQHLGHVHRHLLAMVLGDDRQRQVDTGGHPAGGDQAAILQVDAISLDDGLGEALDQALSVMPVSCDAMAVEQAGMPEYKGAGAD